MTRLRSWSERVHQSTCNDCRRRAEHRRLMQGRLKLLYEEPTQDEIDEWFRAMCDEDEA